MNEAQCTLSHLDKQLLARRTKIRPYILVYSFYFSLYLHRGVEQLVARRAHNPKVAGSSPVPATKKALAFARAF